MLCSPSCRGSCWVLSGHAGIQPFFSHPSASHRNKAISLMSLCKVFWHKVPAIIQFPPTGSHLWPQVALLICLFKTWFLGFFQQSYSECVHSKWESSAHVWTRVHEDLVLCSLCPPWVAQKALHSQINPSASMSHECNFACGQEVKQHISVKSSLCPGFRPHSHGQNPTELCFPLCAGLSSTFKKQGYVSFALSTCK